jgi:sulfopyruvate decarboxylase subunit alpha
MDQATVNIVIDALKESAIDLVVTLPEEPTHALPEATQKDPYFTTVIATGEGNGLAVCGGAALSGRDGIFVTGVAGLLVGTWALSQVGTNYRAPFVVLACYRGDWGDPTAIGGAQLYLFKTTAEPLLNALRIPYRIVDRRDVLERAIREAHQAAHEFGSPVVLLLTGEVVW